MAHASNQTHFAQVPSAQIPRSKFRRDSNIKLTMNAGLLVPHFVDEVLPGDTFNLKEHLFGRLSTPLKPVMDNMYLDTFYFFVPNRLLWENWQPFNGEQENPGDSTDFLIPQVPAPATTGWANQTLADYFGIPTLVTGFSVNSLHFRAYNLIWNEWFRDQNLQQSLNVPKNDGPDNPADFVLRRRGKRHDYFTSCLPFPQKGPAVPLPLGTKAPVYGGGPGEFQSGNNFIMYPNGVANPATFGQFQREVGGHIVSSTTGANTLMTGVISGVKGALTPPTMFADLESATAATINALREAFQVQRLFERDARGGTRYTEIIRSHFGVVSPDARLQRPEYLGGTSERINVTSVANTTGTDEAAQGELAAFGTVGLNGRGFSKSFTEHGVIIGLCSIRADLNYQSGLNRMWSRQTRFDFYWPALSHLGEQAVLNKEIHMSASPTTNEQVFGYQERYAEYRYKPNQVSGKFRSNDPQSLDIWHLAQDFATTPALNASFIEENPPIARVVAVPTEPHLILDGFIQLTCARPMPMYGVPGLIDHF